MGRKIRVEDRIERYCLRFPSVTSRASLRSELNQAHAYTPLTKWTELTFYGRLNALKDQVRPQSLVLKFQRLHRYFAWEIEEGFRRKNPVQLDHLPKCRNMKAPNALTNQEVQRLLKVVPGRTWIGLRDRLAISMMLVHGWRISTVVGMNWEDFETRSDGLYVYTTAKNGVQQIRRVRMDVEKIFEKYRAKTLEHL